MKIAVLFGGTPGKWMRILFVVALTIAGLALVALHNNVKGRRHQRELDALASLDKDNAP